MSCCNWTQNILLNNTNNHILSSLVLLGPGAIGPVLFHPVFDPVHSGRYDSDSMHTPPLLSRPGSHWTLLLPLSMWMLSENSWKLRRTLNWTDPAKSQSSETWRHVVSLDQNVSNWSCMWHSVRIQTTVWFQSESTAGSDPFGQKRTGFNWTQRFFNCKRADLGTFRGHYQNQMSAFETIREKFIFLNRLLYWSSARFCLCASRWSV